MWPVILIAYCWHFFQPWQEAIWAFRFFILLKGWSQDLHPSTWQKKGPFLAGFQIQVVACSLMDFFTLYCLAQCGQMKSHLVQADQDHEWLLHAVSVPVLLYTPNQTPHKWTWTPRCNLSGDLSTCGGWPTALSNCHKGIAPPCGHPCASPTGRVFWTPNDI